MDNEYLIECNDCGLKFWDISECVSCPKCNSNNTKLEFVRCDEN